LPFSGKIEKRGEMTTKNDNIENYLKKGNLNGNIKIITKNGNADNNKICNIKTVKNDVLNFLYKKR
jgi:hypothetical protein